MRTPRCVTPVWFTVKMVKIPEIGMSTTRASLKTPGARTVCWWGQRTPAFTTDEQETRPSPVTDTSTIFRWLQAAKGRFIFRGSKMAGRTVTTDSQRSAILPMVARVPRAFMSMAPRTTSITSTSRRVTRGPSCSYVRLRFLL